MALDEELERDERVRQEEEFISNNEQPDYRCLSWVKRWPSMTELIK